MKKITTILSLLMITSSVFASEIVTCKTLAGNKIEIEYDLNTAQLLSFKFNDKDQMYAVSRFMAFRSGILIETNEGLNLLQENANRYVQIAKDGTSREIKCVRTNTDIQTVAPQ